MVQALNRLSNVCIVYWSESQVYLLFKTILFHQGLTARKRPGVDPSPDQPTRGRRKRKRASWRTGTASDICISFNPPSSDEEAPARLTRGRGRQTAKHSSAPPPVTGPRAGLHPQGPDPGLPGSPPWQRTGGSSPETLARLGSAVNGPKAGSTAQDSAEAPSGRNTPSKALGQPVNTEEQVGGSPASHRDNPSRGTAA